MQSADESFLIVGIGASAGGLEAISDLIAELPAVTGTAFLLVQHLDPQHPTLLTQILAKKTSMAVETAVDGRQVQPDRIYVIPPNTSLTVADGLLQLRSWDSERRPHKPINLLFRSLAEHYAERAVAVVLSGTDADGAQGLKEVKAAGGITLAQTPASAKFEGMPNSAIATGCVDFILPPKELGRKILRLGRHPHLLAVTPDAPALAEDQLKQVFGLLQVHNRTDFSGYKRSTVQRRLARRMALRQVDGLAEYIELLRQEPAEIKALAQDFLIPVTGFFRDPESFAGLAKVVLPALLENWAETDPLRIWVPGCASGEEVYSIAMVLLEYLGGRAPATHVQIFGTDLSEPNIEKARTGFYPESIADEISPERLRRFFVKLDEHYQIAKSIRDWCIFARQDVTRDPPFSRLDLVSCCNLLIYLDQNLQRRIISLLHYGLNPNGFLILGAAETVGRSSELFRPVAGYPQIYHRQPVPARPISGFPSVEVAARPSTTPRTTAPTPPSASEQAQQETERILLTRYAPASVLIDENLNIFYFNGETSRYLEHARGAPSLNLQKLCRPGLLVELSAAIQEAQQSGRAVLRDSVRLAGPGEQQEVSLEVIPVKLAGIESRYWLILFRPTSALQSIRRPAGLVVRLWNSLFGAGAAAETEKDHQLARLGQELDATRDYLQATVEKHEAAVEEMKSAHEEALSANEEFLSTNEELETAKEELQSVNEEMGITNQELRNRNRELIVLNEEFAESRHFLDAIVETVRGSLLVLDGALRVQKVNHEFYRSFQVQPEATIQRPLYELGKGQWNIPALRTLLEEILPDNHVLQDFEVTHDFPQIGEKTMLLNARRLPSSPYREEMILLAIEDITARKLSQKKLSEAEQRKNNFLAMLAHELRNPLAPIRIAVELLRRKAQDPDLQQLNMIERQIQRLVRLVDDLLDIARIERDHVELRKEAVAVGSVVNRAVEETRHLLDERRLHLSLVIPAQPIRVFADPLRLEQVITNLIDNAAKYNKAGGEVAVSVKQRDDETIIEVSDNGIGIAPELLPQLFEMFFQANTALDRPSGGLGIGLSVAKRLVEMQEGHIEGESEGLGKGSKFTIRLPLLREAGNYPEAEPEEVLESAVPAATPRRVLLVDDNRDMVETIAQLVRSWGHEVAVALDGPAALELVSRFHPDLAIIDIGLPQMNGYELARRLRELPSMAKVPLVALTGYGREEDQRTALGAGFTLHLVKPVAPARLEQLLATLTA